MQVLAESLVDSNSGLSSAEAEALSWMGPAATDVNLRPIRPVHRMCAHACRLSSGGVIHATSSLRLRGSAARTRWEKQKEQALPKSSLPRA